MILAELTHVVECRWAPGRFYEVIAAFNYGTAASVYAEQCYTRNARIGIATAYRVKEIATGEVVWTWGE